MYDTKMLKKGIDTLQLCIANYDLPKEDKPLLENGFKVSHEKNELTKNDERTIKKIIPYEKENRQSSKYCIKTEGGYLFCDMSIPKYLKNNNDNTILADEKDLNIFTKKLSNELKVYGIKTNLEEAKISRLDITNNAIMEQQASEYIQIVKNLNMKYIKENGKKHFDTTATFQNTNREICIYDKIYEQTKKNRSNILRNEVRFKHIKTMKNIFNTASFTELKKEFNYFMDTTRTYEEEQLFNLDTSKQKEKEKNKYFETKNIIDLVSEPKNLYKEYFYFWHFENEISNSNILNMIYSTLAKTYSDTTLKVIKNRYKKIIDNMYFKWLQIASNQNNTSYIDLYQELKTKLLAS